MGVTERSAVSLWRTDFTDLGVGILSVIFLNVKFPSDNNDGLPDLTLSYEVLTVVLLNIQVFWDVALCYWVYSSHIPSDTASCARKLNLHKLELLHGILQLLALHYHDFECCRKTFCMLGHTG